MSGVIWRFVVDDCLLCCADCGAHLADDEMVHAADCAQVTAPRRDPASTIAGQLERGPLPKVRAPGSPPPRVPKHSAPAMDGIGFTATMREGT